MCLLKYSDHSSSLCKSLSDIYGAGLLCDVRIICHNSEELWAHRLILGSVSPFLKSLLLTEDSVSSSFSLEVSSSNPVTLLLPSIQACHMRLVLDYIYLGAMFLCASHLQFVMRVIELLHLQIGGSLSKRVFDDGGQSSWIDAQESKIQSRFDFDKSSRVKGQETTQCNVYSDEKKCDSEKVEEEEEEDEENENEECDSNFYNLSHRCVMCGRQFEHESNLKTHLQGHLGHKLKFLNCTKCKRLFRTSLRHALHTNSHRYHLTSYKSPRVSNELRKKILKNYIKMYVEKERKMYKVRDEIRRSPTPPPPPSKLKLKIKRADVEEENLSDKTPLETSNTWCHICQKSLSSFHSYKRHVKARHSAKKIKALPSKSLTEDELACPICDKVFVASSILQRHLKTAKHGKYFDDVSLTQPYNNVVKVNSSKYECHLCNQVFIRVKDLAKHRAKMCSAWFN